MALSGTVYGSAGGGGRTPWVSWSVVERDTTNRRSKIRFTVGSDPVQSTWGTFQGTFVQNGYVYGISGPVTSGVSGAIQTLADEWWNHDAQGNLSITMSLSGSIPGTSGWSSTSLSGTHWVDSYPVGSAPGVPSGFSFTRDATNPNKITLKWAKGSGASLTRILCSEKNGSWWTIADVTGTTTTHDLASNSSFRFNAYSLNDYGKSATVDTGLGAVYTKPPTPGKPTLARVDTGVEISVASNAYYRVGLEVERSTGGTISAGTGTGGLVNSVIDTTTPTMAQTYRVRRFVGAAGAHTRVYSDWSAWSAPVLDIWYARPTLTASVQRATGSTANPVGTNLRVTAAGAATVMPGNVSMTVRARSRVKGTSTWGAYTDSTVVGADPGAFNVAWNLGGVHPITSTYEVQVQVIDTYGSTETVLEVGVGEVALSLSKTGAGVGKVWETGGATLQVNGLIETSDPNAVIIGGVEYQRSGSFEYTPTALTSNSNLFYTWIPASYFPTLPAGYMYSLALGTGAVGYSISYYSDGRAILSRTTSALATVRVLWQLTKI